MTAKQGAHAPSRAGLGAGNASRVWGRSSQAAEGDLPAHRAPDPHAARGEHQPDRVHHCRRDAHRDQARGAVCEGLRRTSACAEVALTCPPPQAPAAAAATQGARARQESPLRPRQRQHDTADVYEAELECRAAHRRPPRCAMHDLAVTRLGAACIRHPAASSMTRRSVPCRPSASEAGGVVWYPLALERDAQQRPPDA